MQIHESLVAAVVSFAFAAGANAACYTIYKNEGPIFRSSLSPVDMSLPFSQTVPFKFGEGATMVYQDGSTACPELDNTSNLASNSLRTPPQGRSQKNVGATMRGVSSRPPPIRLENSDAMASSSTNYSGSVVPGSAYGARGEIQTGPRGGQYYINSNGNKSYVGNSGSRSSRGR